MKKLGILVLLILGVLSFRTQVTYTENASYPFKAITIVEATTFKVVVAEGIQESSLLYGLVTPGEIITIYVAQIFFTEMNGKINNSPSYVLIVSNAVDEDLVR